MLLFAILWQGCSGIKLKDSRVNHGRPSRDVHFFEELDALVAADGVQEGSSFSVEGFPYLRTNRFLVAMKNRVNKESEGEFWVAEMHRLGLEARKKEISNLTEKSLFKLAERTGMNPDRAALKRAMIESAAGLKTYDRSQSEYFERVRESLYVPDEYSTSMRILGLYPLVAMPVTIAAQNANQQFRKWHQASIEDLPVEGQLIIFRPEYGSDFSEDDLAHVFSPFRRNPFGLPDLDDEDEFLMARAFAPVIAQDVVDAYDRFGDVEWANNQVTINPLRATVFYYVTYSFINQRPVLQMNYAFWYSKRSGNKSPAYEKGPLDGITVRLSLDQNGQPMMIDVMNSCGCYHFYAPRKERVHIRQPTSEALYPFVATWLPENYPENRLTLRVNSGWHQIESLYSDDVSAESAPYRLVPYDILESLPHSDGHTESVFNSDGIMKNSWRIEPYILFSMGIPRIGFMRQRGHHAIHIVGRTHFTDPDILDRYFKFR